MEHAMRTLIKHVLASSEPNQSLTVKGWVRTRRDSKGFSFIELNDGSSQGNVQVLAEKTLPNYDSEILHLHAVLGFTLLYVTHDGEEAAAIGTRIIAMREGRIEP